MDSRILAQSTHEDTIGYRAPCVGHVFEPLSWHSTTPTRTPTPTRPTRLQSYVRHTLFPCEDRREYVGVSFSLHRSNFMKSRVGRVGEDPREDVRVCVGAGVVECQLYRCSSNHQFRRLRRISSLPLLQKLTDRRVNMFRRRACS